MKRAVFLDRDGVLNEDIHLLTAPDQLRLLPGVPNALARLHDAGYLLLVVTNQTVVARGLCTEQDVDSVHRRLQSMVSAAGGPVLDGWYVCPHHPSATVPEYRQICDCRKPAPGLLWRGAKEQGVSLADSFMVGDRPTDLLAGVRAGCRTVLVLTGRHDRPPIETAEGDLPAVTPDAVCRDMEAAADWILQA
jgi:D-glycero-D-manno-heptose 1,7-bisphosphate phosphatase